MKTNKSGKWLIGVAVITIVVLGMVLLWQAQPKTPGEKFRDALQKIEKACASRQLGPNEQCGEVVKLKPENPLATPEGRFAHSIKLPEPLPEDSGYREGMTPREYFDLLCENEAGEFVYRNVEDVESVYMMRPRKSVTDDELEHLYVLEDPYGVVSGEYRDPREFVQPELGKYHRLEMPYADTSGERTNANFKVFIRDEAQNSKQKHQTVRDGRAVFFPYVVAERESNVRTSLYGFTWRGITRPNDRELGIGGGELILMDMRDGEVLAVRRGFIRTGYARNSPTGVWWLSGETCPKLSERPNRFFIYDVLRPLK